MRKVARSCVHTILRSAGFGAIFNGLSYLSGDNENASFSSAGCYLIWHYFARFITLEFMLDKPKVVEAQMSAQLPALKVQATGDTRVNFSVPHLLSAASLCRRVQEVESAHAGEQFGEFWHDIFANASATAFAVIAAMESYANELFIDHKTVFPELRVEVMAKLWELFEQKPTLEKFEFAVLLKNGKALDRSASPYQDVDVIIRLRNSLTHFKPEWFSAQEEHAKLSARLRHRAALGRFFPPTEPLFPRGWACHETCVWMIRSVLAFLLDFEQRARVTPKIEKFKDRFNEL